VTRFCGVCHDMRDWLNAELVNVGGVTKQDVDNHVAGSQPLEVRPAARSGVAQVAA
jgi:hypothetical protein